jgi:cytochrome c-type biogenesis protein CcmH
MIGELHTQLATTLPDNGVLNWFANKYGPTVLASPMRGGFDLVAWIVPFAALLIGIGIVVFLIRIWRRRAPRTGPPSGPSSTMDDTLRDRIRQETTY